MKVFLSWSGETSHDVAKLLDNWIRCVLQVVDPWLSSRDIDRGALWFTEINSQLAETNNGIICLTRENLNSNWILFESGALAKGLKSNRIFTFLVDLEPKDVKEPLAQFNHTMPNKDGLYRLVASINKGLEKSLSNEVLATVFETFWPQFEEKFAEIVENIPEKNNVEKRTEDDILSEVLYAVRGMDKRMRQLEDKEKEFQTFPFYSSQLLRDNNKKIIIDQDDIQKFNSGISGLDKRIFVGSDRDDSKKNNKNKNGGFIDFSDQ